MKTGIISGLTPVIDIVRAGLFGAVITVVLAAGKVSGEPSVHALAGGGTTTKLYYGAAMVPYTNSLKALFHTPLGLAVDEGGDNVYVADRDNNAVRMVDVVGGFTYTVITNLSAPVAVALDGDGDLYVLTRGSSATALSTNGMIREYDPYFDLIATNASNLTNANAMAMDSSGNIYVTAHTNQLLEIVATNQPIVTSVATVAISNVLLQGITIMPNGLIAACDSGRNGIYNINPANGIITTNVGFLGAGDGTGVDNHGVLNANAKFFQPMGVAASGDGSLIVTDFGNDRVKVVTSSGITTNLYGVSSNYWVSTFYPGWADGTVAEPDQPGGVAARCPAGIVLTPDGTTVYVTEDFYHIFRQITGGNFTRLPSPAPSAPIGLTASVTTNGQLQVIVELAWDAVMNSGVTNYLVERSAGSGGPYTIIGTTNATTFTDSDNLQPGQTYYYVIQSQNDGGESLNSQQVSITAPVPPPPTPNIGWYDFEYNGVQDVSVMHPVTTGDPYVANNPLNLAVDPTVTNSSDNTYYLTIPPSTNSATNMTAIYVAANGSTPPKYVNGSAIIGDVNSLPPLDLQNGEVTVFAVNKDGLGQLSSVNSASFIFQVGSPEIIAPGGNAAQFTVSDVTTNVIFYYTLDGSDPTNAPADQQVISTNGTMTLSLNGSTNIYFQVRAVGYGPDEGFLMSGISPEEFSSSSFVPNTISWGFAEGECSSKFIGAAGETFYAPVTLTMLPGVPLYSLQFDMTVSSTGPGVSNPGPTTSGFAFTPFLEEPIPGVNPPLYEPIPPLMYDGLAAGIPQNQLVTFNGSDSFVNLAVTNGNQLAVGWVELSGQTNLYNTLKQTLITYSQAHDDLYPNAAQGEPNGVIVGGYGFTIPVSAVNGQQYQIQVNRASGTSDGIGAPGGSVDLFAGNLTNASSMGAGTLNGIKIVTVGSIPYVVGNAYPFRWFNAGDFGNSNLQSADLEQAFETAVYGLNAPPTNTDFYDCMDSSGALGFLDSNPSDEFYGYYTNAGALTTGEQNAMYSGNFTYVNNMVFGDTKLNIADIYLTFLRSEMTNDFIWYQRLWTNGVKVATASYAPGIIPAAKAKLLSSVSSKELAAASSVPATSITNTPVVNFATTDFLATAGQTLSIPINASTFGAYPVRMLMLNLSVVPLDGSPGITTPVQFTPNPALQSAIGTSTPYMSESRGDGNYSGLWMSTTNSLMSLPGLASSENIGTLTVTIPSNATAASSYAIHFDDASASPSGLLDLPNRTYTGLITLSSRTNSYYNDGIPDAWRLKYFGTIYNDLSVSNADADGTGMNNWQKYQAGLNPVDSTSVLNEGIDQAAAQNPQDFVLYWPSVANQTYIIERSPTLFPPVWTPISTNTGDGTYMEIHNPAGNGGGYYQVTTP